MSLTTPQTDWLADFDANVAAFRTAVEASMEADNDPTSLTLEAAQDLHDDLRSKFALLVLNLGYGTSAPSYNVTPGSAPACVLPSGFMWYRTGSYPSFSYGEVGRKYPPNQSNGSPRAYGLPVITRFNSTY